MPNAILPRRQGARPRTTPWAPHIQQDQNAPPEMQAALSARVYALPDVENRPTTLSAEGARGIWLKDGVPLPTASVQPFLGNREVGHVHPWDGSLHIALPPDVAAQAVEAGWAEVHPVARAGMAPAHFVMLYGPRHEGGLEVVYDLILAAYRYAGAVATFASNVPPYSKGERPPALVRTYLGEQLTTYEHTK